MFLLFKNIKKYIPFVAYTARADLRAEVANSYLNWVWWVLEPFLEMCVYSFVFGYIFNAKEEYFSVFIFSGLVMWKFFSKTVNESVKLIRSRKSIVTRIYVPKYILLLESMFVNAYKMLFSIVVLIVMMFFFHVKITYYIIYAIPVLILLFILTFSCGLIFMHFGVFVDDLAYALNILLRLMMYLSGVMYNIDSRLKPPLNSIMKIVNPMAMLIDAMHNLLFNETAPNWNIFGGWLLGSIILCVIGVHVVNKYENSYVKVI